MRECFRGCIGIVGLLLGLGGLCAPAAADAVRGASGDLWADMEVGKRDFGEIAPLEIVPYKVSSPGGVIVDRSVSPGRLYVWDSGNSRVLGLDLQKCLAQASPCSADLVIGQPSAGDYGACNRDSSVQRYPHSVPATASTLCGINETTQTTLEDKSFVSMFVDSQGTLYLPDFKNHRVLKYLSPFTTDTVADDVWGQDDFTGRSCNKTEIPYDQNLPHAMPTASSLCFESIGAGGAGVTLDATGNMWVADGGNNRVLRFPKQANGVPAKTADLVLGQPDFVHGGDFSGGTGLNQMASPAAVAFDPQGNLYVADGGNNRVLVFSPPFTSAMAAQRTFAGPFNGLTDVQTDPFGRGLWTYDGEGWEAVAKLWDLSGNKLSEGRFWNRGGGSLGLDTNQNLYGSMYVYGQDVLCLTPSATSYVTTKSLFSPPGGYNLASPRRFYHNAGGVALAGKQLIATDGRLLFWNDKDALVNGQTPDGFVGAANINDLPNPQFAGVRTDNQNRLWTPRTTRIEAYQTPLATNAAPLATLGPTLPVLGGGQVNLIEAMSVQPSTDSRFLWVAEAGNHRVFRIRNPLTNPVVDVILGQIKVANNVRPDDGFNPNFDPNNPDYPNMCNRGLVPPPNTGTPLNADLTMLCFPGNVSMDRLGNLYVSDHAIESAGNWRMLMFKAGVFPDAPSSVVFAPAASKEFPRSQNGTFPHMTFQPAFDSANRMVVGYNPYSGRRFPGYYNDPSIINPSNPRDPAYAAPDGFLNDFYGWAVAAAFDGSDNLYVHDYNRGQIRIYRTPFSPAGPGPKAPHAPVNLRRR